MKGSTLIGKLSNNSSQEAAATSSKTSSSSAPVELSAPLAEVMRPKSIEEYVGQDSVIGKSAILRTVLESGQAPSLIFWGPPGCGKVSSVCG